MRHRGQFVKGDPRAGRPKGSKNKAGVEFKAYLKGFLESPAYRESIEGRILRGEALRIEELWHHYLYGRPVETIDLGEGAQSAASSLVDLMKRAADGARGNG